MIDSLSLFTYGVFTSSASGLTGASPRVQPSNLIANPTTTSSIKLQWRFGRNTEWFEIWRATSSTGDFTRIQNNVLDVFYNDRGLQQQNYWYKVRRVNSGVGRNGYSNIVRARPLPIGVDTNLIPTQNQYPDKVNRSESLFFNDRQWQMFKHISTEFVNHVAKQQIYYYELDELTISSRSKLYGQSKKKIWKKPVKLYRRIKRQPVSSDRKNFGYNNSYIIQAYFDKNYLDANNIDINYMTGNQIEWDHKSFVIKDVKLFDSVMGLSDYKISVLVTAIYTQD